MALRGIQPDAVQKRLKCLLYGVAGSGKTYASINFPKPYLIDTEKGAENTQYIEQLKRSQGAVYHTTDFDELVTEIESLALEAHEYRTLIIDPLTVIFNNVLETSAKACITKDNPDGTSFGRHYNVANSKMKKLMGLLLKLDMNVIITSHSKTEYGHNMAVIGQTYDCYKKLDYLFDLVFEIQKKGAIREGIVKKSRIQTFNEGDRFPFSYDEIANRYGRNILEKQAESKIFASQEQIEIVKKLILMHSVSQSTVAKWLAKANVAQLERLSFDAMESIINHYTKTLPESTNALPQSEDITQ